nr:cell wall-binding repeat-containing protein [Virgibacillus profundi]
MTTEKIDRISGESRYDTAIEISQEGWDSADTVILARGDNFADALAGVPLAHKLDAPILLTPSDKLLEETLAEIERLGTKDIIILGGTGAIDESIGSHLVSEGFDVTRYEGDTRFETAAAIANIVAPDGAEKVVVANGMDFPDALSVASLAAKDGLPILLTFADELPEVTEEAINNLGASQTLVIGGKSVVSNAVKDQLPEASRLNGENRYETNVEVVKHFGADNNHMYIATGTAYADALTGAVLAAKNNSSILLVSKLAGENGEIPEVVSSYITEQEVNRLTIFGGTNAVSEEALDALNELIQ